MTERRSSGRVRFVLVTVVATGGALVGCGSGASPTGTSDGAPPTASPVATPATPSEVAVAANGSASAVAGSTAPSAPAVVGDILFTIKPGNEGGSDQIWATTADGSRPLRQIGPHGW